MTQFKALSVPIATAALIGALIGYVDQRAMGWEGLFITVPLATTVGLVCGLWAFGRLLDSNGPLG